MPDLQIDTTPCPMAEMEDTRADALSGRPPRRKRVAFALWFGGLIAAGAVIIMGAAPLLAP